MTKKQEPWYPKPPLQGWFARKGWTRAHHFNPKVGGGRGHRRTYFSACERTWFQKGAWESWNAPRCERCSFRVHGRRT